RGLRALLLLAARADRRAALRAEVARARLAPPDAAAGFSGAAFASLLSLGSAAAGVGSFASVLLSPLASSFSAPWRLRRFSLSDLKSVSYQPLPLRRNTGTETSFFRVRLPHEGQRVSGVSLIFCMTSA